MFVVREGIVGGDHRSTLQLLGRFRFALGLDQERRIDHAHRDVVALEPQGAVEIALDRELRADRLGGLELLAEPHHRHQRAVVVGKGAQGEIEILAERAGRSADQGLDAGGEMVGIDHDELVAVDPVVVRAVRVGHGAAGRKFRGGLCRCRAVPRAQEQGQGCCREKARAMPIQRPASSQRARLGQKGRHALPQQTSSPGP